MLNSLTIFFPFYNDEGTVKNQIDDAYRIGRTLTNDLAVIALHGGNSKDNTYSKILEMKQTYPDLVIIDKKDNWEGYAVIKYGLYGATKEWVFYTDGDAQYHIDEDLAKLVEAQKESNADIVNGYKNTRKDNIARRLFGYIYAKFSSIIFELPIRDTDCDFRLIRTSLLKKFSLDSHDASVLAELIKKLQLVGATFFEIPVNHYNREYGKSNYTVVSLTKEKIIGDLKLYFRMRNYRSLTDKNRIFRFGSVGMFSIIFQIILYNFGLINTSIEPFILSFVTDQASIMFSFILHGKYTFKKTLSTHLFVKYYSVIIVSSLIQSSVIAVVNILFGKSILVSNIGYFIGLFFAFIWNYGLNSRLVWKK